MLNDTNVLVVEEEFLIALDIQRMLEGIGSGQILFARSVAEAKALQSHWPKVGLAIVEVTLNRENALELVAQLLTLDIPVVLCSSETRLRLGLPGFPNVPVITKPMAETELFRAIGQALSRRP